MPPDKHPPASVRTTQADRIGVLSDTGTTLQISHFEEFFKQPDGHYAICDHWESIEDIVIAVIQGLEVRND